MRPRIRATIIVTLVCGTSGILLGLIWPQCPCRSTGTERRTAAEIAEQFSAVAAAWRAAVVARQGWLAPDLLDQFAESSVLDGYDDARYYSVVWPLPPRLNPDLPQNPRLPVFFRAAGGVNGAGTSWVCYANGNVALEPTPERSLEREWLTLLTDADYPILQWHTITEKQEWIDRNGPSLSWSPRLGVYAKVSAPATQPSLGKLGQNRQ